MHKLRLRGLLACVAMLALLAVSCSEQAGSGGTAETPTGTAERTASDVGVTEDTITIAYLDPDVEALVQAGFVEDVFADPAALDGLVQAVNDEGGINGRRLELRPYSFDITKVPAGLLNACTQVAEDDPNFIAMSMAFFGDGATCVALDQGMPLLTGSGMAGQLFEPASENLFSFNLTFEENQAGLVRALEEGGALEGKKLGVVVREEPGGPEAVERSLRPALAELGYDSLEVATITGGAMGDPAALSAAAQRFKAQGVDGVFLLTNMFVAGGFMAAAEQEGLDATFFVSDQSEASSNLIAKFGPASELDGAVGTSWKRLGGPDSTSPSEYDAECVGRSEGAAGLQPGTDQYNGFATLCQMFDTMVRALRDAGDNPTRASFVAAMENLGEFPMGSGAVGSFGPGKHTAPDEVRTIEWDPSCTCWVPTGEFVSIR